MEMYDSVELPIVEIITIGEPIIRIDDQVS